MTRRTNRRMFAAQRGLSLVELMVGLTIGMLLVAGLAVMFGNASRSNSELDKSVRQIENGRYAIDLLSQEISLAGYYGTVPVTTASALSSPCLDSTALAAELVVMQNAATPTVPHPLRAYNPTDAAALSCLSNHKAGTPALVVRRVDTVATPIASLTNGVVYVQSSHNQFDNYNSYKAAVGGASNSANFTLRQMPPPAPATAGLNPARRFITRIYYVARCNDCSAGGDGDGIPTLKMVELTANATFTTFALAEGIDQIGFDFGIDENADAIPEAWYGLNGNAGTTENTYMQNRWRHVVALRLSLVSRSPEATAGWSDARSYAIGQTNTTAITYTPPADQRQFKRRGYVTTIRLNSWAGHRES